MTSIELFQRAHVTDGSRNIATVIAAQATSITSSLVRAARRWHRQRRDRAAFMTLLGKEDWVYRDMGISRGDVEWASRLPLHINASRELETIRDRARANW